MLNRSLFKVEKNYIRQAKRGMWAEALFALGKPMHKVKLTVHVAHSLKQTATYTRHSTQSLTTHLYQKESRLPIVNWTWAVIVNFES